MRIYSFLFFILFTALTGFAQEVIYFDGDWNETTKNNASFYRTIYMENDLFNVKDYYITGELQFEGLSKNKEEPLVLEGRSIWYNKRGIVVQEASFKNNKPHGSYLINYEDGSIKSNRQYTDGQLNGAYSDHFPSGKPQLIATFLNGQLNGEYVKYSADDVMEEKVNFKDGIVHGPYKFYNGRGELFNEGQAVNGFKDGECRDYFYEGTLKSIYMIKDKKLDGIFYGLNTEGDTITVSHFEMGKPIDAFIQSLSVTNGSRFSANMKLEEGIEIWEVYRDDKLILESFYRDGMKTGNWKVYSYDGKHLFQERDYSASDCGEQFLQQVGEEFSPHFSMGDRFRDFSSSIEDYNCEQPEITDHYLSDESVSYEDHPFYYFKRDVETDPKVEYTGASVKEKDVGYEVNLKGNLKKDTEYTEAANSSEFRTRNNCNLMSSETGVDVCTKTVSSVRYSIFLSEDADKLKSLELGANPESDEIFFYYQKFEERTYNVGEPIPSRYMGFKLPMVIAESLRDKIMDEISIVDALENKIFDAGSFSGLSAFSALEKAYQK